MFGDEWFGGPNPAFAGAGGFDPDEEMGGWAPWQRGPRGRGSWGRGPRGPWQDPRNRKGRFGRGGGPEFGPDFGPDFGPGRPPWGFGQMPFAWRMGRRFPFGPGMGPGGFGAGGPGRRMFGRGDLKYALLDLLQERPKHGYEMIKDLEERSGGFYTPSAGAIYPTLQLLEDREWVRAESVEGKKVYAITDAGRQALAEHGQRREEHHGHHEHHGEHHGHHDERHEGHHGHHEEREHGPFRGGPGFGWGRRGFGPFGWQMSPELMDLGRESIEVARLLRAAVMASGGDEERLRRLRAIVTRARSELDEFLGQSRQGQQGSSDQPGPSSEGARPASGPEGPIEQV